MVTHTWNLCSAFTHPKCSHTHIVNTHTEQWAAIYAAAPREHFPHLQSLLARDSNLQPLDYESDSLTLGHGLAHLSSLWVQVVRSFFFLTYTLKWWTSKLMNNEKFYIIDGTVFKLLSHLKNMLIVMSITIKYHIL